MEDIFEAFFGGGRGGGRGQGGGFQWEQSGGRQRRRGSDVHVVMQCARMPTRTVHTVYSSTPCCGVYLLRT